MELTDYQKAIAEHIRAAGHSVEWKKPAPWHLRPTLHIDGVEASALHGNKPYAPSVYCYGRGTIWRKRTLSSDPKKAAATLLDRHAAMLRAKSLQEADKRSEQEHADALNEALAGRAMVLGLDQHGVTLRLPSLSVEQARRVAAALGQDMSEGQTVRSGPDPRRD